MTGLALRLVRHRPGSILATLIALAAGVMILTGTGALVESGLRHRPEPQLYGGADLVVAKRDITFTGKEFGGDPYTATVRLPESGTVPESLVDQLRQVPGVSVVVADQSIPAVASAAGNRPVAGHSWSAAALAPYKLVAGGKPVADDQLVVSAKLATDGSSQVGRQTELVIGGVAHEFTVSGIAEGLENAVYLTDARTAALAPHPGQVEVVGIVEAAGADRAAVASAVEKLAASVSAKAYAGADRGLVERSDIAAARGFLVQVGAALGGYIVLLIVFVVAGTVGLSIRSRRRELALLRATGATPWQLRRMLMAEAAVIGLAGSVIGVPTGLLASRWLGDQLIARDFVPTGYPMAVGVLAAPAAVLIIMLLAVVAALLAARRVSGIRPVEALADAAIEPARSGKVRLGFGLASLVGAISSSAVALGAGGQAALAGAMGMLYLFVIAVALLAPWINTSAARLLGPVLRAGWGNSGYLASKNLTANARGMAIVLTALVLAVGFGGSVWFLQDNLERQTVQQVRAGTLAQYAVVSSAGLPANVAEPLRNVSGVEAATAVRRTSVIVKVLEDAEAVPAQAIDPADAAATMDLKVKEGSLAEVNRNSLAVSSIQASSQHWKVGDTVDVWLGDGTPERLRVAAIYERGLAFGDFVLDRATVGQTPDQVLIRTSGSEAELAKAVARIPGAALVPTDQLTAELGKDLAISAWLNKLLIAVMIGYAALSAANTMIMAALARRRELAVLRLNGVTTRQVKRMVNAEQAGLLGVALVIGGAIAAVTLTAVVHAVTGSALPYVPPVGWVAVLGGAGVLAMTTTILPIGLLLRKASVAEAGTR
ncbi:ABC transporter permease [Kribbella qitaiheensis]|uniref:ABC transporter permease n=1 Tax=Kribbella qitaiheensis TaxID=1544730 RepID=A0A7G6WSE3_9ACTN|nr:FtsX family ABC transporter permease [Kribbella qitaiheensis]QNE16908.1 ABC transporter permease [Kribbella qitaiheensis]